jgi:hypothetical protein
MCLVLTDKSYIKGLPSSLVKDIDASSAEKRNNFDH